MTIFDFFVYMKKNGANINDEIFSRKTDLENNTAEDTIVNSS